MSGSLEVVIGRSGVGELLSFPQVTGAMSQTALFPLLSFLLFPRLPDGEADPGATWVDTATASGDAGDMTTTATLVSTYTLVGDTLVDGRALVHIAVAREVTIDNEIEEVGMSATQAIAGSANGFVLWDPERGLVAYAEFDQDLEGAMTLSGVGTIDIDHCRDVADTVGGVKGGGSRWRCLSERARSTSLRPMGVGEICRCAE